MFCTHGFYSCCEICIANLTQADTRGYTHNTTLSERIREERSQSSTGTVPSFSEIIFDQCMTCSLSFYWIMAVFEDCAWHDIYWLYFDIFSGWHFEHEKNQIVSNIFHLWPHNKVYDFFSTVNLVGNLLWVSLYKIT